LRQARDVAAKFAVDVADQELGILGSCIRAATCRTASIISAGRSRPYLSSHFSGFPNGVPPPGLNRNTLRKKIRDLDIQV